jgi:hypothetical protein
LTDLEGRFAVRKRGRLSLYIALALVLVVVVVMIVNARLRGKVVGGKAEPVRLCVLLSAPVELDAEKLMSGFERRWGTRVACSENPEWADESQKTRTYLLADAEHSLMLTVGGHPMPEDLTVMSAGFATDGGASRQEVLGHKGFIQVIYFRKGEPEPLSEATFAVKALLTVLELPEAIGYVAVSGMVYLPKAKAEFTGQPDELDEMSVLMMVTGVHSVSDGGHKWIHTHGMEQFGAPDIEMRFDDAENAGQYRNVLMNAAAYCAEKGPVMQPGHTMELMGDGVNYRVLRADPEPDHEYGKFGAIRLVKE